MGSDEVERALGHWRSSTISRRVTGQGTLEARLKAIRESRIRESRPPADYLDPKQAQPRHSSPTSSAFFSSTLSSRSRSGTIASDHTTPSPTTPPSILPYSTSHPRRRSGSFSNGHTDASSVLSNTVSSVSSVSPSTRATLTERSSISTRAMPHGASHSASSPQVSFFPIPNSRRQSRTPLSAPSGHPTRPHTPPLQFFVDDRSTPDLSSATARTPLPLVCKLSVRFVFSASSTD